MSEQDSTTPETSTEETPDEQQKPDADREAPPEDDRDDAWDPERAKRKISKVNSENKALRERATAAEKKAQTAEELERKATDLSTANLRLEVGYELGLPLSLAKRLQGSTKEEMVADAEALVELVTPKAPASRRPAEQLRGGGQPEREPEETDLRKIGERMFRR